MRESGVKEMGREKATQKLRKKAGKKPLWVELDMESKLDSVEGWARQGATNAELAEMLGVSVRTVYAWKGEYPQFAQAIRAGARESDGEILKSAFEQARGYTRRVTEIVKLKEEFIDERSGKKLVRERAEAVEYDKYFEPDGRVTRFMLTNRLKDDYRDKRTDDAAGEKDISIGILPPGGEENAAEYAEYMG